MNKTELVSAMAEKAGMTKTDAHKALNAFMDATVEAMKKGDKVTIPGFGTFSVTERAARMGVNPSNKKKIKIAAKKSGKFKMSKSIEF
ncbi:MAG: HU family DNA-binding protein [Bacteroidales bacterium]|nr:HU family DNA-binding protein [Bacteroidales bacterium]